MDGERVLARIRELRGTILAGTVVLGLLIGIAVSDGQPGGSRFVDSLASNVHAPTSKPASCPLENDAIRIALRPITTEPARSVRLDAGEMALVETLLDDTKLIWTVGAGRAPRTIASVASAGLGTWVDLVPGWSDGLLLRIGSELRRCWDFYEIDWQGASARRLTSSGLTAGLEPVAMNPDGLRFGYVPSIGEADALAAGARIVSNGQELAVGVACSDESWRSGITWAPTGDSIATSCGGDVVITDIHTGANASFPAPRGGTAGHVDMAWSAGGRDVLLVGYPFGGGNPATLPGLEVGKLDVTSGVFETLPVAADLRVNTWPLGAPALSPDGRWLFVGGTGPGDRPSTRLVDLVTGVEHALAPELLGRPIWQASRLLVLSDGFTHVARVAPTGPPFTLDPISEWPSWAAIESGFDYRDR
jgi:hypothetical protein